MGRDSQPWRSDWFAETANLRLDHVGRVYLALERSGTACRFLGSIDDEARANIPLGVEVELLALIDAWYDRIDSAAEARAAYGLSLPSVRRLNGPRRG